MKRRYTRKQIAESINYWNNQLVHDNYAIIHESFKHICDLACKNAMLNESDMKTIERQIDDIEKNVAQSIKSPDDVKKFVQKNDKEVKEKIKDDSTLAKGWELLKKILKAGVEGANWMLDNWKVVLIVVAAVSIYLFGLDNVLKFLGMSIGKVMKKTVDASVKAMADGFATITGPGYLAAGEKISAANAAAGGYSGWTGLGLGGGLR